MSAAKTEAFLNYEKSLACIHCGLCLSSCPTYLETGNENDSPRGRIYIMRAVQNGRLALDDAAVTHIDRCLGCRACEVACPSGVQYGELLECTRDHIEKNYRRSLFQRFLRRAAIEQVFPFPSRLRIALAPARFIKKLGIERFLPAFARDALALIPKQFKEEELPEFSPTATAAKHGRVGFVRGCVMSVMFSDTNASSVRLLNKTGWDVVAPTNQICCGALYAHGGNLEQARENARRNIEAFDAANLDAIIINAAGCGSTLKEYGHLLHDDAAWAERAKTFSAKVKDLTEWLVQSRFGVPPLGGQDRVTYHDACHLAHPQRITREPRELVRAAAGRNLIELPESDVCCGSAGSYNLTEPELAARLQNRKTENILKTGAKIVITTNPGCILQIRAGLAKAGAKDVQVMHIADYLDTALVGRDSVEP